MILKTNRNGNLSYNHIVLAATFRVKNNIFAKQLQTAIREDEAAQNILKEISLGDIKEFTEKEGFLLF